MSMKPSEEDVTEAMISVEKAWRENPDLAFTFPKTMRHPERPMYAKAYGQWAGNNAGRQPDFERCCAEVYSGNLWFQCSNKAKHDPDATGKPTTCGTHSIAARQRRSIKEKAQFIRRRRMYQTRASKESGKAAALNVIMKIAEGHNDPRGLCQEFIDSYRELFQ